MSPVKNKLLIIGAGGHGKVCADIAEKLGYEVLFADDHPQSSFPYPIIGGSDVDWEGDCFIGIGNPEVRERLSKGRKLVSLIHPNAVIGSRVRIGNGSVVMAGAVINADSVIGDGVVINTCSSVDHDCTIGDYVHVAVGAHVAGTVTIGKGTWVGAGVTVKNNINICAGCMIGAGAVVVKDISEPGVYIGVPARK